ncbi:MAG: hypothetical protein NTV97_19470, partial [Alphaproteobacteria bacterium]|nr:hypothetical protein [Alphaproteobacteria bacterium]
RPTVRGVFGEPRARIITLARRTKKRSADAAGGFIGVGTTGVYGWFALCVIAWRLNGKERVKHIGRRRLIARVRFGAVSGPLA